MTSAKAGEWWIHNCGRIRFVVGTTSRGLIIIEENGMVGTANEWKNWHHEPRCDSFDWVEPPAVDPGEGYELLPVGTVLERSDQHGRSGGKLWIDTCYPGEIVGSRTGLGGPYRRKIKPADPYPHYYESLAPSMAYARRDSDNTATIVRKDGTEIPDDWFPTTHQGRTRLTEDEALARVMATPVREPVPVESSSIANCPQCGEFRGHGHEDHCLMDWVEITDPDHVLRADGVDMVSVKWGNTWYPCREYVGIKCSDLSRCKFRCRRKDLPAIQPVAQRIPVRLWCSKSILGMHASVGVFARRDFGANSIEIKHDGYKFYVEATE